MTGGKTYKKKSILIRIKETRNVQFLFISIFFPLPLQRTKLLIGFGIPQCFFCYSSKSWRYFESQRYTIAESYIINKRGDFNNSCSLLASAFCGTSSISLIACWKILKTPWITIFKRKQAETHIILINLSLFYSLSCLHLPTASASISDW